MDFLKSILFGNRSQSSSQQTSQPEPEPQPETGSQKKKPSANKDSQKKGDKEKKPKVEKPKEEKPKGKALKPTDYSYILPPELLVHMDSKRGSRKLKEGSDRANKVLETLNSPANRKPKKGNGKKKEKKDTTIERIKLAIDNPDVVLLNDKDKNRIIKIWEVIAKSCMDVKDKQYYRELLNKLKDSQKHVIIKINAPIPDEKK